MDDAGPVPLVFERVLDGIGRVALRPRLVQGPQGYVTHELPPGPLHVETTRHLGHPSKSPWRFTLDMATDVVIPAGKDAPFDLPCRQGGAFRLSVEAPGGDGPWTGPVSVRGPKGQAPNVWWYRPQHDGSWRISLEGDRSWEPDGKPLESQAFEPGDWHLRIGGGQAWRDVDRSLRLEAGRITEIQVVLEPRWRMARGCTVGDAFGPKGPPRRPRIGDRTPESPWNPPCDPCPMPDL